MSEFSKTSQLPERPGVHQGLALQWPVCVCLGPGVRTSDPHQKPRVLLPTHSSYKKRSDRWRALSLGQCGCGEGPLGYLIPFLLTEGEKSSSYARKTQNKARLVTSHRCSWLKTAAPQCVWQMLVPRNGSFQAKKIRVICKQIRNQELRSLGRNFRKADLKTATHSKKLTKYLLILIFLFSFCFEMEKIYGRDEM